MVALALLFLLQVPPEGDVRALVQRMTLDEKIALVHGARDPDEFGGAGYWPGLPRLGIPPMRFADGPPGVNVNADATAMPAPVALAATFSSDSARLYGTVLGREARSLRQDVLLASHINIVRDPLFRRNHTTLSEDPLLTARLAAAEIKGIQSQGVMATVKHLAGYNGSDNVVIDERALHEIYLPVFEAAVKAGVASVMCAYNQINGAWACESPELQNDILRGAWGFRGFVVSDWGAIRSSQAITKGADLEMPGRPLAFRRGGPYFTDALKGAVGEAAIDQSVIRILTEMKRFGLLGRARHAEAIDIEADAKVVREIAEQGAVLLKNDRAALPLRDLASVVVIGPTAGQLAAGFMGERAYGFELRLVSPLDALRKTAPNIAYAPGVDLTGEPIPGIAEPVLEAGAEYAWSGTITVTGGDYTFMVQPAVGNGAEGGGSIGIDGQIVTRTGGPGFGGTGMVPKKWSSLLPTTDGRDNGRGSVQLTPGSHKIEIAANSTGEARLAIRFAWTTPELRRKQIDAAVAIAQRARTAIVFAWQGAGSLTLPEDQDNLIERVAAVVPKTIVVLNTGGPVAMPWKDRVGAILEMWYPGQEGGWATADLLLGRANPSGKLPVTFPVRLEDAPARAAGHAERMPQGGPPGSGGAAGAPVVRFTEGIAVGYRWYDQQNITPLFPFGHGLSYTRFEYSDLKVEHRADGLDASFTVRNAGARRGAEVAQVYLGAPETALRSLAGFERLELAAGESHRVTIHLGRRQLSYWSTVTHDWAIAQGGRTVFVGSSSRDLRLKTDIL